MDCKDMVFKTSLSDNGNYPELCLQASLDNATFRDFRRNEIYNITLEHDSFEQGLEYLEVTQKSGSNVLSKIHEFIKNDQIGNPRVFDYEAIGKIAPTTLRYIKILSDLESEFGTLDNYNICEIGVGYGGLCRIISSYFHVKSYTLVDLKPVLLLAQRYLDHFPLNTTLIYKTMNELRKDNYDLVISNYAFTEIRREVQQMYLEKVLLSAKRGYITYNEINPEDFNSYTKEELIEILPQIRVKPEVGILHPKDCTLVW
ncbi:Putative methyltransferase [Planktothrix tepida]|uniref:Putative methyltransferase n=1 Tax=Planktothrix tepida PCC 9214 TaxID=671072 RepID=A0A1J1LH93_9CYAN|nr:putative sugar O-methyltransferase [Planktothrix tepida]CAD5928132.1 Putative methyltransferase [Planktothrix tepida]CUR31402.1 putative methyltransferase [Planktothrix tepida PCC 9214]